jgi:hypothetical protein
MKSVASKKNERARILFFPSTCFQLELGLNAIKDSSLSQLVEVVSSFCGGTLHAGPLGATTKRAFSDTNG